MPPVQKVTTFKIPFQGGSAIILALVNYTYSSGTDQVHGRLTKTIQYNEDGTTKKWDDSTDINITLSVSNGVMTVNIAPDIGSPGYTLNDCRCCIIPGDPFA